MVGGRQAADGEKRLVQAAATTLPPSSAAVAVLFLVAEAMLAAMLEADGDERLMSQTTWRSD